MKKSYPVVRVYWFDAETSAGWQTEAEVDKEPVGNPVCTIGFLVRRPSKTFPMYIVASTLADQGEETHFNATIKIPKAWVKSIEVLNLDEAV